MSDIKRPPSPSAPAKVLDLTAKLRAMRAQGEAARLDDLVGPAEAIAGSTQHPEAHDAFLPRRTLTDIVADIVRPAVDVDSSTVRPHALKAHGVTSRPRAGRVAVVHTPLGPVIEGSVTVDSAKGLRALEGVVRIMGDLTVSECMAKSADFVALSSLIEVDGRLAVEGAGALVALNQFMALERVGGLYIGSNPKVARLSFDKLSIVTGAVILEINPALVDVSFAGLKHCGRYLHAHEQSAMTRFSAPLLESTGGELSFVGNTRLVDLVIASAAKPARVRGIELVENALPHYPKLFVS